MIRPLPTLLATLAISPVFADYTLDSTKIEPRTDEAVPGATGKGADGVTYAATKNGFRRDGKPWIPVSGEFHYVRYNQEQWDRELAKIRAGGVDVVATYVFWNHHENPEGVWDWTGRRDLRRFLQLAQKNGLKVWLRPGPYINAEAKNGGIPDFANKGKRSNNPEYLKKVDAYFKELEKPLAGMFVKDGGPIVGVQLENEFASGDAKHITQLRAMCEAHGFVAPFYSVTANTHFEKHTAIPLQGSYVYRGWQANAATGAVSGFIYGTDDWTANTDINHVYYPTLEYPRGYAELGTGSPMNGSNRFLVDQNLTLATAYDSIGRGGNFIGYYMYHGGTQVPGLTSGWPLTYDFQAPLGEFGRMRESYRHYRRLHTFLSTYADTLVPTRFSRDPEQIMDPKQKTRLRYIGRFDKEGRGFVFVNNAQRNVVMPVRDDVRFDIAGATGHTVFPAAPMKMPPGAYGMFPFMNRIGDLTLRWGTVMPSAKFGAAGETPVFVYRTQDWTTNELCFAGDIEAVAETGAFATSRVAGSTVLKFKPDARVVLRVGKPGAAPSAHIVVLTDAESLDAAVVPLDGRDRLVITAKLAITAITPSVVFSGKAGDKVGVRIYPADKLAPGGDWKPIPEKGFARFEATLGAGPAAPKLTPAGKGVWKLEGGAAAKAGLAEARFEISYIGGEAKLRTGKREISNDYYHDENWSLDLNGFTDAELADMTVSVSDWSDNINGVPKPEGTMPAVIRTDWIPTRDISWR